MSEKIGIIGGSGFYQIDGLRKAKRVKVKTPFGAPSDDYVTGELEGMQVVFLARHGKGHTISPSELNYCANIYGMKKLGVGRIVSVSACGSLREDLKPLDIVIPDQFVDRTNEARRMTLFGNGIVAHVQFADPVCKELCHDLFEAGRRCGATMHQGGTYINMEGPQFSTRAESQLYRSWGMDIIGMTNLGEAKVAREAEICYASLACITDYDCWHDHAGGETVSLDMIISNLLKNVGKSKEIVREYLRGVSGERSCGCASALKNAIVTDPKRVTPAVRKKLKPIIGKYLR